MTKNNGDQPEPTMKAISQDTLGEPGVLHEIETARPKPGVGQILVAVHAAGVNPTDWKHRATGGFLGKPPFTLGWDVSGVVEAVGIGVALHKPGDEVMGMLPYPYGAGSHAEYVTGPARAFVPRPAGLGHVEAGALPLVSLTAWQALVDLADVQPGQRVLVHAAAGGVGHVAVQIAKARGAYVIGTASAPKHDFVRSLGADEVIDYRTQDFVAEARDIDVVLDTLGEETRLRSLEVLRPGGVLVSILPGGFGDVPPRAAELGVRATAMLVEHDQAGLRAVAGLVEAGKLTVHVSETYPLADAAKAHEAGETGRVTGKLVLTVRP
ncbi:MULTISPECIES: NADP-dependent oxidoreductase [unclassified Streptomyces]|uniref:NADP-dependent oxidoreductase n=1 Tax=unclassified Streptomyces TaxID=2593676 RepID=UPI000DB94FD6|nr:MULTISPECIES: NADP-dependent oxidoreductase [unclassified Streptomyces]MYT73904.1 zinc-binding dehydrogenase [Streptomyces sp. SID8367]RAJ89318.1 NADPH:quinone reductase-like Zn-dependent oxidoreductase [Streptomyces sp. PsTaAH-137]